MKIRGSIILAFGTILILASSCQKELSSTDIIRYDNHPLNDTVWQNTLPGTAPVHSLFRLLAPVVSIDSFPVTKDTTLNFGDSLEISFTAGSCTAPGAPGVPVSGIAKLELFHLRSKGDYIKAFKPTTSNGYLLESAGAFFLRVTKDGKELALLPGTSVKIRFVAEGEPKINCQVFNGREGNPIPDSGIDTAFNWVPDADSSWIRTFQKPGGTGTVKGYEMFVKNLRWVSAERYLDSTAPKAKLSVILPLNYTNKNTAAFAVFADHKTVVHLKADYASRTFAAVNIPKGKKFRIVTITKIAEDMYLGTKDVDDIGTTAAFSVKPEKKSLQEIIQFLNTL
jgi:hypothetical protein